MRTAFRSIVRSQMVPALSLVQEVICEEWERVENSRTGRGQSASAMFQPRSARVRPLNEAEKERGEQSVVFCPDKHSLEVCQAGRGRCFSFDAALGPDASQDDLFQACQLKRLVDMATQGYSCTVFAFGQTGSGKTYTISGPHPAEGPGGPHSQGLTHRCLSHLLQVCSPDEGVTLHASYLEIYNEQVRDLLDPRPRGLLTVRGSGTHGFCAENPTFVEFLSLDSLTELLSEGQGRRHTSSHLLNERSSRGHAILTVDIRSQSVGVAGGGASQGKLRLVDLAGSERVKLTGCGAEHLEEAGNINRSLLSLGKCIAALVEAKGRNRHIPYRDSKLTKLLSDSLGGPGLTLMIACVSPTASSLPETLNTLYYSSQARRIRPRPSANQGQRKRQLIRLHREIHLLRQENLLLRQDEAEQPDCQESSSQQGALLPGGDTLDKLRDLERVTSSPPTPPPPRDSAHSRPASPYFRHPPSLLPPIRPELCFHCHWRPLLYCICPAGHCLQGVLPPLPALSSDRAARERARDQGDRHSWETDPGSVRLRRTKAQSGCMVHTSSFQVNSSSQQAKAPRPHPPRSEVRVTPSAPPLPKQPRPLQLALPERTAEHAQAV
ncbi:kinesin-like protein KIF12 [Conger conger]|uniref:kinesin-like protein KIF12 n=1 Tax=Conger conger TaxID=82655 RepID=UPI002A5A55A1|nr:kinesin-like protein KIF12 [Conger conger]